MQLPFARFRTINPKTDGRLDVAKTRAIVFVLDARHGEAGHARARSGSSDVGVYR